MFRSGMWPLKNRFSFKNSTHLRVTNLNVMLYVYLLGVSPRKHPALGLNVCEEGLSHFDAIFNKFRPFSPVFGSFNNNNNLEQTATIT